LPSPTRCAPKKAPSGVPSETQERLGCERSSARTMKSRLASSSGALVLGRDGAVGEDRAHRLLRRHRLVEHAAQLVADRADDLPVELTRHVANVLARAV
jgi:hypothetical protein